DIIYIDDYAHHPEELKACISSVKELYPDKKITGIFQPHLFTRTKDFADEFAKSLDLLDKVILLDIYPARELPIEGVSSEMILEKIKIKNKKICSNIKVFEELKNNKPEVLLTLGAGDIDQLVEPIKNILQS
ncbi:MAG: UDP-N-acetylmuramate--L-alanine ligase, partial [Bacteroidales bacterium]|nr:UDP-N-acetylmuramate--L-alanine ligase [Bacteroidales bacterium]